MPIEVLSLSEQKHSDFPLAELDFRSKVLSYVFGSLFSVPSKYHSPSLILGFTILLKIEPKGVAEPIRTPVGIIFRKLTALLVHFLGSQ